MPIFKGTWKDGEGVGFDADSFPISQTETGGTARRRIHGRRGGSGSPPGKHHGSDSQAAVRLAFGLRTREYVDIPPASPDTQWELDGQSADHLTRAGVNKRMHGQAFYPHSTVPPSYGDNTFSATADDTKLAPPIIDSRCRWQVGWTWAQVDLEFSDAYTASGFDGVSIFQVNPRSRNRPWEVKHTRLASSGIIGDIFGAAWGDWPFDLVWPCNTQDELRVFARVWNYQAFLNFGPITSEPYP